MSSDRSYELAEMFPRRVPTKCREIQDLAASVADTGALVEQGGRRKGEIAGRWKINSKA